MSTFTPPGRKTSFAMASIRRYYCPDDGNPDDPATWRPAKNGVSVKREDLPALRDLMRALCEATGTPWDSGDDACGATDALRT